MLHFLAEQHARRSSFGEDNDVSAKPGDVEQQETTGVLAGGRTRPGDVRGGRSGHRAIDARAEMAAHGELAEVARYAVWRMRVLRPARRRDYRWPIPNPGVRCGRNRAR